MKWFYNLKMYAKLIISFVLVALIAGVVGVVGIININKINNLDTDMYQRHTATMDDLAIVMQDYQIERAGIRDLVIEKDSTSREKIMTQFKEMDKNIDEGMNTFDKGIKDPKVRDDFENLKKAISEFRQYREKVTDLITSNKEDQAVTSIYGEGAAIAQKVQENTDSLLRTKVDLARQSSETNDAAAERTRITLIIVILAGMLIAIALGIFISKIITTPVKKLMDLAEKLSLGDIDVNIEVSTKDEIGSLMMSFEKMVTVLRELVEEQGRLTSAAAEGDLNVRGDAGKFKGSYHDIVMGVNNTLDAVIEPIQEASLVLKEMAKGKLKVKMEGNYKGDHAAIKEALNSTLDFIDSYIDEISEVLKEMAEGNMNVTISRDYLGDFIEIKNSLNQIIGAFNKVLGDINNSAQQVASGASQVSQSAQSLSQGSTEQASSVEELTASLEEISAQTRQNAANANEANTMALTAKDDAVSGNERMKEMLKSMNDINDASSNISKIIKVIDEIAFQTNILALNAAVEAARAGQHGKGFAVVAEEVRNLAARSANAAKETTVLIEGSIKKAENGTKIAAETAGALNKIVEVVTKAANLVGEIATASNEQASGIAQVNQGIMQVSQVIQTNSTTSEESASASEELSSQAEMLKEMVSRFKLKKEKSKYSNIEELNPEVLRMLENMSAKKNSAMLNETVKDKSEKKAKIVLSDKEFGKY